MITENSDGIRIDSYVGTWYVIDCGIFTNTQYEPMSLFLLEHEDFGDSAENLIVNKNGTVIMDDVWNGFKDLEDDGWTRLPL